MNNSKHLLLICFSLSLTYLSNAQNPQWEAIETPDDFLIDLEINYSENLGLAVIAAPFLPDSIPKYYAGIDQTGLVVIADSINGVIRTSADYQNGILVGGDGFSVGTGENGRIAYFDGQDWTFPFDFNGNVKRLKWTNDTLFALGYFMEIDSIQIPYIAKLVNGQWERVLNDISDLDFAYFKDIEYFQGQYYVAGNFESIEGPDDFAVIDENGNLALVGEGLLGNNTSTSYLTVYQDELYVSGGISMDEGNLSNHILKWNGIEYSAVGEGPITFYQGLTFTGAVLNMEVIGDYLYIGGNFRYIGDHLIPGLARWDGTEWCGLFTEGFNIQMYSSFGRYQDQLICVIPGEEVTDHFLWRYIGGDEVENCTGPLAVGLPDQGTRESLKVYPNPAHALDMIRLNIAESTKVLNISVYDITGRIVIERARTMQDGNDMYFQLPKFQSGTYVVEVRTVAGVMKTKLVIVD